MLYGVDVINKKHTKYRTVKYKFTFYNFCFCKIVLKCLISNRVLFDRIYHVILQLSKATNNQKSRGQWYFICSNKYYYFLIFFLFFIFKELIECMVFRFMETSRDPHLIGFHIIFNYMIGIIHWVQTTIKGY